MPRFLNNCRARDHVDHFGPRAFYDLNLTGRQATMATDLEPGEKCIVATPEPGGDIDFSWFSFTHEDEQGDKTGTKVRVLYGKRIKTQRLTKRKAAKTKPYSVFFNINGHFKRPSVIKPKSAR